VNEGEREGGRERERGREGRAKERGEKLIFSFSSIPPKNFFDQRLLIEKKRLKRVGKEGGEKERERDMKAKVRGESGEKGRENGHSQTDFFPSPTPTYEENTKFFLNERD
jgi:hypothetical protein